MKLLVFFVVALIAGCSGQSWNRFPQEISCSRTGGICVETQYCGPISKTGLCPNNQKNGVECCHVLNIKSEVCEDHLGECRDWCHPRVQAPSAVCPNSQVCCILT